MADSFVLDASAILALLQREEGEQRVREALREGECRISSVNVAEVASCLYRRGLSREDVAALCDVPNLEVVDLTLNTALSSGELPLPGRAPGFSLGDRTCLALGLELGAVILTADRVWARLESEHRVEVIR